MDKDGLVPITFKSRKHGITKKQYPLVNIQKAIENGPVERVDLPSYKMVIFPSFFVCLPGRVLWSWMSGLGLSCCCMFNRIFWDSWG